MVKKKGKGQKDNHNEEKSKEFDSKGQIKSLDKKLKAREGEKRMTAVAKVSFGRKRFHERSTKQRIVD